jgi:hypothetical protein
MKRLIAAISSAAFATIFASCLSVDTALADYNLKCKYEDTKGSRSDVDVTVKSTPKDPVNSLREACAVMKSDPAYSDYNWQSCVAANGRDGTCLNPV